MVDLPPDVPRLRAGDRAPVGFMMGLVLAVRPTGPTSKRGLWIIGLSIVGAIVWVLAIVTGLVKPNSNTST